MWFTNNTIQQVVKKCAESKSVFRFFPARQVPEIPLNESSKNTENALIEWPRKETTRYFTKTKVYVVCLVLSLVFETVFGIFWQHYALSQICKLRNVWKLPSPFSRNTLISSSEKTSWTFKGLFWKKIVQEIL
jgi:hypothetical protein